MVVVLLAASTSTSPQSQVVLVVASPSPQSERQLVFVVVLVMSLPTSPQSLVELVVVASTPTSPQSLVELVVVASTSTSPQSRVELVVVASTPSGSFATRSGGGGMEAWFQAEAASVDVSDTDSARIRTTAWRRLNSSCTQLRDFRPWTRMLPFVQYRCMTSCFRSPWCSLTVVWHSSAGVVDTHGALSS